MAKNKHNKQKKGRVFLRKRKPYQYEKEIFGKPVSFFLKKIKLHKSDGYMRKNIFGTEIIWQDMKMHFSTKRARKSYKYFFIFALVRKDAIRYMEENGIKKNDWQPSIHYNKKLDLKKLNAQQFVGIDMDSAYWNVGYKLGILTQNTFEKGLQIPDKTLGLAALASMGSDKSYTIIKDGLPTNDRLVVKGNDDLKEVYKLIRFTCFKYMRRLASLLGNDYVCYRTDAIYFINTPANIQIARDYMERHDLDYKLAYEQLSGVDKKGNTKNTEY